MKNRPRLMTFGNLAVDVTNVRAVAIVREMHGGGFTSPQRAAEVILESGERLSVSPKAAKKLIKHLRTLTR